MSRAEIQNEKNLQRRQASDIIDFPNGTMILGVIELVFLFSLASQ